MVTNNYLEYYMTLLAWIVNNGIWSTLVSTGVFAVPLAAIIIDEWLSARAQGADEGNKGLLSIARVENRMWVAYVVIAFCCIPFVSINLSQMKYSDSESERCGRKVIQPQDTGWDKSFHSIGEKTASVPVWWYLVHALGKGITSAATAALPCAPDIRSVAMKIDQQRIADKVLLQELSDFTNECYARAKYRFYNNKPEIKAEDDKDIGWVGSSYFLTEPGYYDSIQSLRPRKDFPYNESRDATLAKSADGGGYPTCREWWSTGSIGLRDRLMAQIDPSLWEDVKAFMLDKGEAQKFEMVLRDVISPEQQNKNMKLGEIYQGYGGSSRSSVSSEIGNAANQFATQAGLVIGMPVFYTAMNAMRASLPMVQAFLIMAVIICLPFVHVISTYSLKAVMVTTFGLFSLYMLTFWWDLARWVDSSLLAALYTDTGFWDALNPTHLIQESGTEQLVIGFVMGTMFLVLPSVFIMAMGWSGMKVGQGIEHMIAGGAKGAQEAGGKGAGTAIGIASKGKIRA